MRIREMGKLRELERLFLQPSRLPETQRFSI